jgi:hypothetical protein
MRISKRYLILILICLVVGCRPMKSENNLSNNKVNIFPSSANFERGRVEAIESGRLQGKWERGSLKQLQAWSLMEKETYSKGEDARVLFLLINCGDGPIIISSRLLENYSFYPHIRDQNNREMYIPYISKTLIKARRDEYLELEPGNMIGTVFHLGQISSIEMSSKRKWQDGSYSIFITYRPPDDGNEYGLESWTKPLDSNSVAFRIK